ncbi:RcnB family protein [Paraburkholderia lycopersici]|uniref:Nickel/cobalt transporter regulator n=1 Tax=Paraburkholderia lycopersici TaxID=416944 RepID=A0A1G6L2Y6_9BURK|nr:RcnB family protein [Paraburkholderia lycopersici]SDC37699.1 Nickel/cobalt transporter regulator [Paraburkholderia lycopersici]
MNKGFTLLAALAIPALLASTSTFAQQPHPGPNEYRGGPPPNHPPPPDMPPPHWGKGERVPAEYRDRQYVIDDWRQYHLKPPPRGYHWVGAGGQYYLVRNSNWVVERVGP